MKKLGIMIALLLSAGSTFAGDFEQAQNAGFDSTKGTAALIAFGVLVVATVIFFLWKKSRKSRAPITTTTTAIATMLSMHAGDFQDRFEHGDWSRARSGALVSGIDAAGRANSAIYNYVQRDPMGALGYARAFTDTSSTSRATSGAMIEAGRNSGDFRGDLGYGYYTTWGNGFAGALGGPAGAAASAAAGGYAIQVKKQ